MAIQINNAGNYDTFTEAVNAAANGDIISINIPNYTIELKVSEEEMAARRAEMPIKKKENITGYLKRYAAMVSSADKGAIINQ